MILRLQILWLLLLSACSTLPSAPVSPQLSGSIPLNWQASGRLSITQGERLSSYRFHLQVHQDDFELRLSDALGFSQMNVEQRSGVLLVNQQSIEQDFRQWSLSNLGGHLSPKQLGDVLFAGHTDLPDWQLSIAKYQQFDQAVRPKLLRLEKADKALTIKLLFSDINS